MLGFSCSHHGVSSPKGQGVAVQETTQLLLHHWVPGSQNSPFNSSYPVSWPTEDFPWDPPPAGSLGSPCGPEFMGSSWDGVATYRTS